MKTDLPSRCWAEIDEAALQANAQFLKKRAGPEGQIMAVIKADAYGHGLAPTVRALCDYADWFGVANLKEGERTAAAAREVRPRPVLIMSPLLPQEYQPAVSQGFSISVSDLPEVEAIGKAAQKEGRTAKLHAVADTGMGRMGALHDDWPTLLEAIQGNEHCQLEGICSHFSSADCDEDFTDNQIAQFSRLIDTANLREKTLIHLCNSAGLLLFSEKTQFAKLMRPGLAVYGVSPVAGDLSDTELRPALALKTRVTLVRDLPKSSPVSYGATFVTPHPMKTATIAAGYGDGYPRHLSGQGADVLIGGVRCPVLGRITMDQTIVNLNPLGNRTKISPGEEAVLIGMQGKENISITEVAAKAGTIPWEILTGITSRVDRVYLPAS